VTVENIQTHVSDVAEVTSATLKLDSPKPKERHRTRKIRRSSTESLTDARTCQTANMWRWHDRSGVALSAGLSDVTMYVTLCQIMNSDWWFGRACCLCLQGVAVQQDPEQWSSTFLRNVRNYQPADCTSHQTRRQNPKTLFLLIVGGDQDLESVQYDQQHALFAFSLFRLISSTCFKNFFAHHQLPLQPCKQPADITRIKYTNCCVYSACWLWANKCLEAINL
jgi:hypothetical protein